MQRVFPFFLALFFGASTVYAQTNSENNSVYLTLDHTSLEAVKVQKVKNEPQLTLNSNRAKGDFPVEIKKTAKKIKIVLKKEEPKKQSIQVTASRQPVSGQGIFAYPLKKFNGDFVALYKRAANAYGLPWQILAAVHIVETGQRGDTNIHSYAGAVGPMQFLPSTFAAYGVDGNGDGQRSIYSVEDSVFSAANYIAANYRRHGSLDQALFRYNRSWSYVSKVMAIARSLGM